jgi:hypothetical protein
MSSGTTRGLAGRGLAVAAGSAAVVLALSACSGQGASAGPTTGAAITASSAATSPGTSTPSPSVLTKAESAKRYQELADAYRRARGPLDKALDQTPVDIAVIRSTAAVAATAFRARISGLLETSWPADVKPLIDDYVTKAAQGLNLLNVAAKAKSIDEIVAAASQDSTDAINAADTLVRVKLGLPTVDNS